MSSVLRHVPSVEKTLVALGEWPTLPRRIVTRVVREEVERIRTQLLAGSEPESFEQIVTRLSTVLTALDRRRLQPVINGTGVILHTNLGRAPLAPAAIAALSAVGVGYANVELDLNTGDRGARGHFTELLLAELLQAEAATVVNNCAAALVVMLRYFVSAGKKEVIISRSELVEIGGGFRVPEIMETSGAILREIGTTNKCTVRDYERAITPQTALILKVHRSNFYLEGFTAEPTRAELVALARQHGLPIAEDLGSGAMLDTAVITGLEHETTAQECLADGIDVVCISGDKLFGGQQAGLIAGRRDHLAGIKKEPFFRALRVDKLVMLTLQETLLAYLQAPEPLLAEIPAVEMLRASPDVLATRAERLIAALRGLPLQADIAETTARCGGGTMPKSAIPSRALRLRPDRGSIDDFLTQLRSASPPIIGYISEGACLIDLRTVFPAQDDELITSLKKIASS
jgi:L-seryl-tRNA(Ser) seleniumtransferase